MFATLVATRVRRASTITVWRMNDGKALIVRTGVKPLVWTSDRTPTEWIGLQRGAYTHII